MNEENSAVLRKIGICAKKRNDAIGVVSFARGLFSRLQRFAHEGRTCPFHSVGILGGYCVHSVIGGPHHAGYKCKRLQKNETRRMRLAHVSTMSAFAYTRTLRDISPHAGCLQRTRWKRKVGQGQQNICQVSRHSVIELLVDQQGCDNQQRES